MARRLLHGTRSACVLCLVILGLGLFSGCGAPARDAWVSQAIRNPTLREIARRRRLEIASKAADRDTHGPGRRGMSMVYSARNAQNMQGDDYTLGLPRTTAGTRSSGVGSSWNRNGFR